jgi:hypothetical protein
MEERGGAHCGSSMARSWQLLELNDNVDLGVLVNAEVRNGVEL